MADQNIIDREWEVIQNDQTLEIGADLVLTQLQKDEL